MDTKRIDLDMPMPLYKKLEKEKARRIPTVPIRHLILEALAEKYLGTGKKEEART